MEFPLSNHTTLVLLSFQVDWFFSDNDSEEFPMPASEEANTSMNLSSSEAVAASSSVPNQNQSLLLGNIHKVEGDLSLYFLVKSLQSSPSFLIVVVNSCRVKS